jgi:hypothetical protein
MKYDPILIPIYAVMFILIAHVALISNSIVCEILSYAWGFGLLVLANNYRQPAVV